MQKLLLNKFILVIVAILTLVLASQAYATQPDAFYFTANQPPTREPGIQLWQSFYQWASKHPTQIQPLCLKKSFRCSINLLVKPNKPITVTTFISLRFFQLPKFYHFQKNKDGWQRIKQH